MQTFTLRYGSNTAAISPRKSASLSAIKILVAPFARWNFLRAKNLATAFFGQVPSNYNAMQRAF